MLMYAHSLSKRTLSWGRSASCSGSGGMDWQASFESRCPLATAERNRQLIGTLEVVSRFLFQRAEQYTNLFVRMLGFADGSGMGTQCIRSRLPP